MSTLSGSMRGNTNRAMWGKARRVDPSQVTGYSMELGRRIRDLRLELDISIDELSAASGVAKTVITRLERGVSCHYSGARNPHYLTIVRIALALGVMPSEVMP